MKIIDFEKLDPNDDNKLIRLFSNAISEWENELNFISFEQESLLDYLIKVKTYIGLDLKYFLTKDELHNYSRIKFKKKSYWNEESICGLKSILNTTIHNSIEEFIKLEIDPLFDISFFEYRK